MKTWGTLCFFLLPLWTLSQDSVYVRMQIDTLTSPVFQGRGYSFEGGNKAAEYLQLEMKKIGLKPFSDGYLQEFELAVNTFPGKMEVTVNGKALRPGEDFIVHPGSKGLKADLEVLTLKPNIFKKPEKIFDLRQGGAQGKAIVLNGPKYQEEQYHAVIANAASNPLNASAMVVLTDAKLTWTVGKTELDIPVLEVKKESWPKRAKEVQVHLENVFVPHMKAYNVAGYIPGTEPDSFIVFMAHYDHLGNLGKDVFIAGANDNASGTAMLLDIARHYVKHKPRYNVAFIFFGAEEAGLIGSSFYVENPLFPLEKIKFLINLDLMGDAGEGITAVNGKIYPDRFNLLEKINEENGYLKSIAARGPAANSDHYPFYEKGVPGFFIYTRGTYPHYHDIDDISENLPLKNYRPLFKLVTTFADRLQSQD